MAGTCQSISSSTSSSTILKDLLLSASNFARESEVLSSANEASMYSFVTGPLSFISLLPDATGVFFCSN